MRYFYLSLGMLLIYIYISFSTEYFYALRDLVPGLHVQRPSGWSTFSSLTLLLTLLLGRRRHFTKFLVYDKVSRQLSQEYDALKEPERREWMKDKLAERQIVRKVCGFTFSRNSRPNRI